MKKGLTCSQCLSAWHLDDCQCNSGSYATFCDVPSVRCCHGSAQRRIYSCVRGKSSERRQLPACGGANKRKEAESRRRARSLKSLNFPLLFLLLLLPSSALFPLHLSVTLGFRHQAHVSRTDVIYQGSAPRAAHPSLSSPSNTPAWATLSGF